MKRALVIFFAGFLSCVSVHAQQIILKGQVRESGSGKGIPFAHVGICKKAIGTVTNENGEFVLKLDAFLGKDTLCISSIGYETSLLAISGIRKNVFTNFDLKPHSTVLTEIVVSGEKITAKRIIEKAVNHIRDNYPVQPFILDGYYRDYLKKDNEYISLLEAAVSEQDPGFKKPGSKAKVKIEQIRISPDYEKNFAKYCSKDPGDTVKQIMAGFSPFVRGNEFTRMKGNDPIRNYNDDIPMIGEFNRFYDKNLKFDISYKTEMEGRDIYVIKFGPSDPDRYQYVQAFGEIYVRADDYAILKFSFNYFISLLDGKKKIYQLNIEYRDFAGRMFLNYISYVNYFKIYTGDEIADLQQYREFFVNDIRYPDFKSIHDNECIDPSTPLSEYKFKSKPGFWDQYNIVLQEKPLIN